MVKRKHSHSKNPHEWQWTLRRAAFRETGNWTSLSVASERNWGEGVCIVGGQRKELSRCGGRCRVTRRDGMEFQSTKKSFPGLFCCCCCFGFCLFVCFKTLLMHATTWHQYPALPRTNEMVTREILSWFVVGSLCTLYSGLPLSSQISI